MSYVLRTKDTKSKYFGILRHMLQLYNHFRLCPNLAWHLAHRVLMVLCFPVITNRLRGDFYSGSKGCGSSQTPLSNKACWVINVC